MRASGSCGRYAIKDYFKADEQEKYLESFITIHRRYHSMKELYSIDTAIAAIFVDGVSMKDVVRARAKITYHAISQVACQLPSKGDFTQYELTSKQILRALNKENPLHLLEKILDTGCSKDGMIPYNGGRLSWRDSQGRRLLPYCKTVLGRGETPSRYLRIIHQRLNRSFPQQPVEISYCSRVLKKGKGFNGLKFLDQENDSKYGKKESKGKCGKHASLVIGRKWNSVTNKCQLLIRNSWGTSCNSYHSDWDCDNGNIWVNQEDLGENIYEVQHLDR